MNNEKECIFCNGKSFGKIIEFKNHPMFGQKLLSKNELINDKGIEFDIVKCNNCNLVQIGNEERVDKSFYDDEYICTTGHSNLEYQKKLVEKIIKKYNLYTNNKKIIELGCGDGFFSKQLSLNGCNLYAIEPSGKAYEYAKGLGINVERKYINNITEKFDFFILRQVLEHISNPNMFIKDIINIMNTNFNGIIEVPRLEYIYEKNRIYEFYPEHIVYYDLGTLSNLLSKYFTVNLIKSTFDGQYLIAHVSNKKYLDKNNINIEKLHNIIKSYNNGEVAMWGAGAKGINILGLLGEKTSKNIILIDGDKNKVGKYTSVTHIITRNKDILKTINLKAIIISADMYKKEIVKELYEKYNYKNDIILISDKPEVGNILKYYS